MQARVRLVKYYMLYFMRLSSYVLWIQARVFTCTLSV